MGNISNSLRKLKNMHNSWKLMIKWTNNRYHSVTLKIVIEKATLTMTIHNKSFTTMTSLKKILMRASYTGINIQVIATKTILMNKSCLKTIGKGAWEKIATMIQMLNTTLIDKFIILFHEVNHLGIYF